MAIVRTIPAKKRVGSRMTDDEKQKLRVAAYCRVSTESDEQATSFDAQIEHYTNYITTHPGWKLADIYADDGISGTNTKEREGFNRLIEDCMKGKIDLVVTKSISRFARNTLDCLKYIRLLKDKNIAVYFEKENINTLDAKGEILLTIMASLAQQESQSLSQNVKLGLQYRYQQGKVQVCTNRFLGYDKDEDGNLIINPEEAEVVKRIYREYLEGKSYYEIGKGLTADGIKTAAGSDYWLANTLKKILSNEKYIGDALLQKTVTTDFLTKKRVINKGIAPQYYVEGNHEPIIPKELYTMVQEEMARRANLRGINGKRRIYSGKYALSSLVYCSHCGDVFQRTHWNNRGKKKIVWRCVSRLRSKETDVECPARTIEEEELHRVVIEAVNEVFEQKDGYLERLRKNIGRVIGGEGADDKNDEADDDKYLAEENRLVDQELTGKYTSLPRLEKRLSELQQEVLQKTKAGENIDDLKRKIDRLQERKYVLRMEAARKEAVRRRIQEMEDYLDGPVTEYSEKLVRKLIERIMVYDDRCDVEFKSGIVIEVYS